MSDLVTTVLLIEDDPNDAAIIQAALSSNDNNQFRVERVTSVANAKQRLLIKPEIEVILLDLNLPDGLGVEAFDQIFEAAPGSLILVLSNASTDEVARLMVKRGAADYLSKGHIDAHWLPRALRYILGHQAMQEALGISEARFRAMSDASPLGIFVTDVSGDCVYTNTAYQRISGLTADQALGTQWGDAIHEDDRPRILSAWQAATRNNAPFQTEFRFHGSRRKVVWARVNSATMYGRKIHGKSNVLGFVQTIEDISFSKANEASLRRAETALFAEKERAEVTLRAIGDGVLATDPVGQVTYLNPSAEAMTGWSNEAAMGHPVTEVFHVIDGTSRLPIENPLAQAMEEEAPVSLKKNAVLIGRDGSESSIEDISSPIRDRDGHITGAVIVFHDVSETRAMSQRMSYLAQHDPLTDLPNRVLLTERLNRAIGMGQRHRSQVALLYIDLDHFKHINDSLGHQIGDGLLRSVAKRMAGCVRDTDTLCRQGGDEFVILLSEIEDAQDAVNVADKLLAINVQPHLVDAHELHVGLSIGISIFPDDGTDAATVMKHADTAMYQAKLAGRNQYRFFTADMNQTAVNRQVIEKNLRRALKDDEFVLHYQPKINLLTGAMTGSEALIRWQDPEHGLVYPDQFVAIAEESGLISAIGQWVLIEACRQSKAWQDAGRLIVPVAINISALEFKNGDFLANITRVLKETGLPPHFLQLELTEGILMRDAAAAVLLLHDLKALGLTIAIDDFGTGYSSLSYLKNFPIDTLKIDQSFVRDIATDANNATIVNAIIGMGKSLKQRVIAEGVETQEQYEFLQSRQCEEGQGFLFSNPLVANDFAKLLASAH